MYPLRSINTQLVKIIAACYSNYGPHRGAGRRLLAVLLLRQAVQQQEQREEMLHGNNPVSTAERFLMSPLLPQNDMAFTYKCGAEFLPSPLASKAEFAPDLQDLVGAYGSHDRRGRGGGDGAHGGVPGHRHRGGNDSPVDFYWKYE